jgi:cyclopropane fatty-acyl-phospholipid synthase-like methyltransferase
MDFFDLMGISHRYMEILNPSTPEKILKLGKLLKLKQGSRVIDFGCGCAASLILWAEEFGITGVGVDISQDFCDRAKKKLAEKGYRTKSKSFVLRGLTTYLKKEPSMLQHVLGRRLFGVATSRQSRQ